MFDPVDPKQDFPALERGILQYWKEEAIFHRSMEQRAGAPRFSFYDGPPFATGLPHYGHLLAGTMKDVIPRYHTMRGKNVQRRFGWDCHGLPVENLVEKEQNLKSRKDVEAMGIAKFNDFCRSSVQRYTKEWRATVERMGRFVDMDFDYRTMDPEYMESIWWVFKQLWEKGLIEEGYKPMHICPRCATPLSNFEVGLGYADRTDQSVVMTFPLQEDSNTILLAWTTTPWSLPGNFWLAVGPKITYAKVLEGGKTYILAQKLVEKIFKGKTYEIVGTLKAKELLGKRYQPLFPYFVETVIPSTKGTKKHTTYGERVFNVVMNDAVEVSDEEGTGIVHLTSCTGEDSNAVATAERVDVLPHIRIDGTFIDAVTDFAGMNAKPEGEDPMATDLAVIKNLKSRGRCFSNFTINHSYPHCWRCETPLLPYVTNSWFVKVETIKEKLLQSNAQTEWVPQNLRDGRFGKWLANARDWAISRNRYWGTPLPIWRSDDKKNVVVISSRDELMLRCPARFTKITALRHAQSEGNVRHIYQGNIPGTPLTDTGKSQAETTAKSFTSAEIRPTAIYCSPLLRTRQTAETIGKEIGVTPVIDERLREIAFGDYEGKKIDFSDLALVKARRAKKLESNAPESIYHYPGMETWAQVNTRMKSFLQEILQKHVGEHIVIVSHADPLLNLKHFFTQEDPVKISHQPYPNYATPITFFWDHVTQKQLDLHKETVDGLIWKDTNGAVLRRIPEVLDCWFESGSMPVAQEHFPFSFEQTAMRLEKKKLSNLTSQSSHLHTPPGFPANFIAEGLDQTRGWFYTLMVLGTALFNKPAFEHCVVNGIVLAEDGKKMSKRLKNYPEPTVVIEKYGADALRFALMSSPAVRAEDLRFSDKLVEHALRSVVLPLWNAYGFFVTYANAAKFTPSDTRRHSPNPIDRWIRAEVQDLINRMTEQLERYDLSATCSELYSTIDALTNWYIRLSRRRFAGKTVAGAATLAEDIREQQHDSLHTLYDVLLSMIQLLAPICPFVTDAIYQNIVDDEHGSVHLTDWPEPHALAPEDAALVQKHRILRSIVSLGLRVRSEQKIKVRQPLAGAVVVLPPAVFASVRLTPEDQELLRSELHVKNLSLMQDPSGLGKAFASVHARVVGPRLGPKVQEIIAAGKRGEFVEKKDGTIVILGEVLEPGEFTISYQGLEGQNIAAHEGIIVSVDTHVTDTLQEEGVVRDLIRAVQRLRKEQGLLHTDCIHLQIEGVDDLVDAYGPTIANETNAILGATNGTPVSLDLGSRTVHVVFSRM